MTIPSEVPLTVALLATGDEICHGDILNSNSQQIALRLTNDGIKVGLHLAALDNIDSISDSINHLLISHRALIITGGLGPTSDDLTRYALSKVMDVPLVFNEKCWFDICARLQRFGYTSPPESNRQQALFPEESVIIPNSNGTAAGCYAIYKNREIFMLPGPPQECLPMVDSFVLPTLKANHFQQNIFRKKWLLFGVSEGKIAEELDLLLKDLECKTGYRLSYPYLEFKIQCYKPRDFTDAVNLVEKAIQEYIIEDGQHIASELLQKILNEKNIDLTIQDSATCGSLEATLTTPSTRKLLKFIKNINDMNNIKNHIEISGLEDYWRNNLDATKTDLSISMRGQNKPIVINKTIPFRGKNVVNYAVEFIAWQIYLYYFWSHP